MSHPKKLGLVPRPNIMFDFLCSVAYTCYTTLHDNIDLIGSLCDLICTDMNYICL